MWCSLIIWLCVFGMMDDWCIVWVSVLYRIFLIKEFLLYLFGLVIIVKVLSGMCRLMFLRLLWCVLIIFNVGVNFEVWLILDFFWCWLMVFVRVVVCCLVCLFELIVFGLFKFIIWWLDGMGIFFLLFRKGFVIEVCCLVSFVGVFLVMIWLLLCLVFGLKLKIWFDCLIMFWLCLIISNVLFRFCNWCKVCRSFWLLWGWRLIVGLLSMYKILYNLFFNWFVSLICWVLLLESEFVVWFKVKYLRLILLRNLIWLIIFCKIFLVIFFFCWLSFYFLIVLFNCLSGRCV